MGKGRDMKSKAVQVEVSAERSAEASLEQMEERLLQLLVDLRRESSRRREGADHQAAEVLDALGDEPGT